MVGTIGVLALQGAYQRHLDSLHNLGVQTRLVRRPEELTECAGLVIPGGESTTMSLLLQSSGLYASIREFAEARPVMGVCAGMILMADKVDDPRVRSLRLMSFRAKRNHYGRQVHSFSADVDLHFNGDDRSFPGIFIRAPGVADVAGNVQVLASLDGEPVMLGQGRHMALSFHPELTEDSRIHAHWLAGLR